MNESLSAFQSHESIPGEPSAQWYMLEQIREYLRHHLTRISDSFTFSKYASVHLLLDCLLMSDNHMMFSQWFCPDGHLVNKWESYRSSCYFVLLRAGCGLQQCMDDIMDPLSEVCPRCDVSLWWRFTLMHHPPLVAIELGKDTSLINELELTSQDVHQKYHLRGVIYFMVNHFTVWLITSLGMMWYHNGIFTGQSLVYESTKAENILSKNVIVGIYLCPPEQNLDMPQQWPTSTSSAFSTDLQNC